MEVVKGLVFLSEEQEVSVNFEYSNDVHISLSKSNWEKFIQSLEEFENVQEYFKKTFQETNYSFDFEQRLKSLNIPFEKIAFVDFED